MDPEALSATLFKWDPRGMVGGGGGASLPAPLPPYSLRPRELGLGGLEELFQAYGIRYYTAAKIAELGFTVSTLLDMKDEELEDMINSLSHIFRWELLVGERYGIKAAVRAERRRVDDEMDSSRRRHLFSNDTHNNVVLDALSQEGLSEEPVQQEKEVVGSGGGGTWEAVAAGEMRKKQRKRNGSKKKQVMVMEEDHHDETEEGGGEEEDNMEVSERQREHPFIVTEPGEVARGKKNGLDYLFHLYEQCREFLIQVQNIAKERGEKCPTKVTNQVFRYAKKVGASYINKPKMRHYVHCYALHCLDEEASNALRRVFKERGENVGAWRQACYKPLVATAASQGWDIDAIFNAHPRLAIWYVPTKLRQLCHAERNSAKASTSAAVNHLPF
ncbi:floricaula/leafy homolog isoform X1 [Cucurbita moschata]|uniref:Floricaula/leafy-like transcription factor n=1 Tax=Cucurbita moschata TaxID=3662 RepID=A0A6J1ELD5_CUCMO|nr:floricaula/leafy homolog isoform X1 [Cucurbita moschata]